MRTHINCVIFSNANILLPGKNSTNILPQMFITDDTHVFHTEITPSHPHKGLVVLWSPGIHNRSRAIGESSQDQSMHRDFTKIKDISARIEADNVGTRRVDGNSFATTNEIRHKLKAGEKSVQFRRKEKNLKSLLCEA